MEQSSSELVDHMPPEAMQISGDQVQSAGTDPAGEPRRRGRLAATCGRLQQACKAFSPHQKALGLDVGQTLPPSLLGKATRLKKLKSEASEHDPCPDVLEMFLQSGSGL